MCGPFWILLPFPSFPNLTVNPKPLSEFQAQGWIYLVLSGAHWWAFASQNEFSWHRLSHRLEFQVWDPSSLLLGSARPEKKPAVQGRKADHIWWQLPSRGKRELGAGGGVRGLDFSTGSDSQFRAPVLAGPPVLLERILFSFSPCACDPLFPTSQIKSTAPRSHSVTSPPT